MVRLKGLLVDVGGTLISMDQFGSGLMPHRRVRQLTRLREAYGQEHLWFETLVDREGPYSEPPDFVQPTRVHLQALAQELGTELSDEDFMTICRACRTWLHEDVQLEDGAVEAMRAARALGLKMAIFTNTFWTADAASREEWAAMGLADCFDAYVTSLDAGHAKPHPVMFHLALERLGLRPEEVAILGDTPDRDILGGHALGLRTIWIRPPNFEGPCTPPPDAEIGSLRELLPILERWGKGDEP